MCLRNILNSVSSIFETTFSTPKLHFACVPHKTNGLTCACIIKIKEDALSGKKVQHEKKEDAAVPKKAAALLLAEAEKIIIKQNELY
jgi:hypothetical protein